MPLDGISIIDLCIEYQKLSEIIYVFFCLPCSKIADKKEKQEKKKQDSNSAESHSCNVCCADLDISSAKK